MSALFKINSLSFSYEQGNPVFSELTLNIDHKAFTLITGSNGSGKTTLARLLTGLNKGYQGSILLRGEELAQQNQSTIMDKIIYIKQDLIGYFMGITPEEDLQIWQNRFQEKDSLQKKKARTEVLALLGVDNLKDIPVWELSYGQKRKVMLAASPLLLNKFWILDEPSASLDKESIYLLREVLKKKKQNGSGVMILTHRPELFDDLADIRYGIRDRKIVPIS